VPETPCSTRDVAEWGKSRGSAVVMVNRTYRGGAQEYVERDGEASAITATPRACRRFDHDLRARTSHAESFKNRGLGRSGRRPSPTTTVSATLLVISSLGPRSCPVHIEHTLAILVRWTR
jgi:hypothetical protein